MGWDLPPVGRNRLSPILARLFQRKDYEFI